MQRLFMVARHVLRLRCSPKSARVADESSADGGLRTERRCHRDGVTNLSFSISAFFAVMRVPLSAASHLCNFGGDAAVGTADPINLCEGMPFAIYV